MVTPDPLSSAPAYSVPSLAERFAEVALDFDGRGRALNLREVLTETPYSDSGA